MTSLAPLIVCFPTDKSTISNGDCACAENRTLSAHSCFSTSSKMFCRNVVRTCHDSEGQFDLFFGRFIPVLAVSLIFVVLGSSFLLHRLSDYPTLHNWSRKYFWLSQIVHSTVLTDIYQSRFKNGTSGSKTEVITSDLINNLRYKLFNKV